MKKRIVLCADDYGQASSISQGILNLLSKKRLSAVSCLVNQPNWPETARLLKAYQTQVGIGLHYNLTEGMPVSQSSDQAFQPLPTLVRKAVFRQLDPTWLAAELNAQIDRFIETMGPPDFIDGHQHVHQLPQIRDVFLKVYQARFPTHQPYVRQVYQPVALKDGRDAIKKLVLRVLGAGKFKQSLVRLGLPHNPSFSGMYSFIKSNSYRENLIRFLVEIGDRGLIMCHPGLLDLGNKDPIREARFEEYTYFSSDRFLDDCNAVGVEIVQGGGIYLKP